MSIEQHPLAPFLPSNAKLLMLGSFPSPKHRWTMDFYYPNFNNDMWRIFGIVFFQDKDYFIDAGNKTFKLALLIEFLTTKGIAIYDSATQVVRQTGNASDKFLQIIQASDIQQLLGQLPQCEFIVTTGEKATEILLSQATLATNAPKIMHSCRIHFAQREVTLYRLPSSSRAYPLALEKKAALYQQFFQAIELL